MSAQQMVETVINIPMKVSLSPHVGNRLAKLLIV